MKKISAIITALFVLMLSGCENVNSDSIFSDNYETPILESSDIGDFEVSEPEYVEFFKEKAVHTLKIDISQSDWSAVCAAPKDKEYQHADIVIDDAAIADCGIKTHGNSTLDTALEYGSTSFPFKIKFDKYTDNSFWGLDELVLCNNSIDFSYARQYAGYEAFRAIGGYAPLCTFFNVYLNDEFLGVYTGVEEIDKSFLNRVFNSSNHNLYKTDEMATLTTDMVSWAVKQKKGKDTSKNDLNRLVQVLDEMPLGEKGEIESILDVDSALKYIAVGAVIHHCDGYGGYSAHNYMLYFDDGVFHVIPWDMDMCFYQTDWGFRPSAGAQMDIKSGLSGEDTELSQRPLIQKLLAVDEYYKVYLDYCSEVLSWLKNFGENEADPLYEMLYDSVKNDPRGKYHLFNSEFNSDYHYGFAGYIKERAEYLEKRIPEIYKEKGFIENQS